MLPTIPSVYPEYVADQVLTAHDLNESFRYLDEQGRMTRTNLIGIGIVCGLTIQSETSPASITITKGVGVTSAGYLITVPTKTYTKFTSYDPVKDLIYDRFAGGTPPVKKFELWELVEASVDPAAVDLSTLNLDDKIVLIFVELLQVGNKNCDPNSCDDKGRHYEVTFRPLLVTKENAQTLITATGGGSQTTAISLPDVKMRRFDVPSTPLLDSGDLFQAYQKILSETFITKVGQDLKDAYLKLLPILSPTPADPVITSLFTDLKSQFKFLYDGSITPNQLINLQYYYDFFSDLLAAYRELRDKSRTSVCECSPDESLFPRHLLLGEAIGFNESTTTFRHRFMASPALCCCKGDADVIKILFVRLVLLIRNFFIPNPGDGNKRNPIRITPSLLSKDHLSEKAIPFYYKVNVTPEPLFASWDAGRSNNGTANQVLSYHAADYNAFDDFVRQPLLYDLEPYNFLRIEGHIGLDFEDVLATLTAMKRSNRLPFETVAISSDLKSIYNILTVLQGLDKGALAEALAVVKNHACCFADIFLLLDDILTRIRCCLLDQFKYYLTLPAHENNLAPMKDTRFKTGIMAKLEPEYEIAANTIGHSYQVKLEANEIDQYCARVFTKIATEEARPGAAAVIMPHRIDRLAEVLPDHITDLDPVTFEARYKDVVDTATQMRNLFASPKIFDRLEGINRDQLLARLNISCLTCLFRELQMLLREFLLRLLRFMLRQKLGYYAVINPGIQHKAGVTMGGTFVIVYHEQSDINLRGEISTKLLSILDSRQPLLSSFLVEEELKFLAEMLRFKQTGHDALVEQVRSLRKGVVIADFYLPYLCCSDCPPVAYVLPRPPLPDALTAVMSEPECDQENKNYSVTVTISGGQKPYTINNQPLSTDPNGNTDVLKFVTGTPINIVVRDKENASVTFTRPAFACCPYPCDGAAEKCRYVLWFQRPGEGRKIVFPDIKGILSFTDENGQRVDVSTNAFDIFKNASVDQSNYDDIIMGWLKILNEAVPPAFKSSDQPMFDYDREKQVLTIERFTCQTVDIEMELLMVGAANEGSVNLHIRYNSDNGVTIEIKGAEGVKIPKFGCSTFNKCRDIPGTQASEMLIIEEIRAKKNIRTNVATFASKPNFKNYFWYFSEATVPYSNAAKPTVTLLSQNPQTPVRLLVTDQNGNFGISQQMVEVL